MESKDESYYELAKEGALSNDLLAKWLINIEDRLRRLEFSLSPRVTWEVSQAELAETRREDKE